MARLYKSPASIAIGARGFLIDHPYKGPSSQPPQLVGVKRGKVNSFSSKSAKRLRRALMRAYVPGVEPYGLTLTVPITVDDWHDDWYACFKRFRQSCLRLPGFVALIWRVELQSRGMPHLHCLVWVKTEWDIVRLQDLWRKALNGWRLCPPRSVKRKILGEWMEIEAKTQGDAYVDGALDMSRTTTCLVDSLSESSTSVRYLCDHTSKRKQAQLGYQGRQWGIVGGNRLSWIDKKLKLSKRKEVLLDRLIRCWARRWYNGHYRGRLARLHLGTIGCSEVWADDNLRERILTWLRQAD